MIIQHQQQDNLAPSSTSCMPASTKPGPCPVGPDTDPVQSHPSPIQYLYRTNNSATPGQCLVGAQPKLTPDVAPVPTTPRASQIPCPCHTSTAPAEPNTCIPVSRTQ
ncbi:hypothetical protein BDW60DRAFT_148548 [Aspergillus nidulans var. acristatus]